MELKIGQFKRFNTHCGIARVLDENNEDWYVVYATNMPKMKHDDYRLGRPISKAKNSEDALKNALIYFTKLFAAFRSSTANLSEYFQRLEDKTYCIYDGERYKKPFKLEITHDRNDYSPNEDYDPKKVEKVEADIGVFEGKAQIFVC